jgi:hypothetical protein
MALNPPLSAIDAAELDHSMQVQPGGLAGQSSQAER